ncbi:MAG: hypothetical protein AABW80_00145 [Nanoarchaeota archaeon]
MKYKIAEVYTWLYRQFSNKPPEKRRGDSDPRTLDLVTRLKLVEVLEKTSKFIRNQ